MPPPLVTNQWFSGKQRPAEFGPVTITFEEIAHHSYGKIDRVISVSGVVALGATKGRPSAPEPSSGIRVSQAAKVPSAYRYDPETGRNAFNTGIVDAEKGHVMALELGGPDIPENIVPQWAKWQGSGEWRQMEVGIAKLAEDAYNDPKTPHYVQFHCMVGYLAMKTPQFAGRKRLLFPNRFRVVLTQLTMTDKTPFGTPLVVYDDSPQRNITDDMLALRTMISVDKRSLGEHFEAYDDWVEDIRTKGGKTKDQSSFLNDTQSPIHAGVPPVSYSTFPTQQSAYDRRVGNQLQLNHQTRLQSNDVEGMDVEM